MEDPNSGINLFKPNRSTSLPLRNKTQLPNRWWRGSVGKWLVLAVLGVLVVSSSAFLVAGFSVLLGNPFRFYEPLFISLIVLIAVLGLLPISRRLLLWDEHRADVRTQPARLRQFDFSTAGRISEIVSALRDQIRATLPVHRVLIFVYNADSGLYLAAPDEDGSPGSDLCFADDSALVAELNAQNQHTLRLDKGSFPAQLDGEKPRLDLLDVQALIPLIGRKQLLGWVALGGADKKILDNSQVIQQLEKIATMAASALERVLLTEDLQNRMREMDVLIRVAQGVNVTLALDDIHELVYAQTARIIPLDVFRIVLFVPPSKEPRLVFSVRGEERYFSDEKSFSGFHLLPEYEAVLSGCVYVSGDYASELRVRGIEDSVPDCSKWLAAPLRAGAEVIGSLGIGRREVSAGFSAAQQQTVQAIADLAAGAIVKAWLLAESEKRAYQLKTLYDLTHQLSSTLDQNRLFTTILKSAVDILACEAGCLWIADDQSNELIIRGVLGKAMEDLINNCMPFNSGIAGKSYTSHKAVIANGVELSKPLPDVYLGMPDLKPCSLLAAPMVIKDHVLGVIEVINHKDGSDFTEQDLELLTAFAAQAAVAVENAALYAMTDHALAARVEELSVMQRIDRELNTSLDVNRAMKITLDWAMRRSEAVAGLVGMVEPEGIRLMASQGYSSELSEYPDQLLSASTVYLDQLTVECKPVRLYPERCGTALLDGAQSQIVVPIQRENKVIGVILLESKQPGGFSEEKADFLMRLGDHASIAIANAQLYNAIQVADIAKSEFVSFVAHELKNPMTSIKGYTELLAARAVGPVNENQASFLQVILANIERMNKLVSDLNDLTKIEAGRMRLEFSSLAVEDIVSDVQRSTNRQIEEKGQRLSLQIPEQLPPVWADRDRLMQILVNLVSNAHKYTDQGGEITLGAQFVMEDGKGKACNPMVHIWVSDNGIGISPEDQARIFQKFFRSEDPKTREIPGAGLGLNITRSLVEMQGGRIWFESEYGKGTTFHFTVPVAASSLAVS